MDDPVRPDIRWPGLRLRWTEALSNGFKTVFNGFKTVLNCFNNYKQDASHLSCFALSDLKNVRSSKLLWEPYLRQFLWVLGWVERLAACSSGTNSARAKLRSTMLSGHTWKIIVRYLTDMFFGKKTAKHVCTKHSFILFCDQSLACFHSVCLLNVRLDDRSFSFGLSGSVNPVLLVIKSRIMVAPNETTRDSALQLLFVLHVYSETNAIIQTSS